MKKITIKLLAILLLATMLISSLSMGVFAETAEAKADDASGASGGYTAANVSPSAMFAGASDGTGTSGTATNIIGAIITIAQIIGVGVAIIMLIVLAIKYISAAPGDKAEIKKHAVVYIVGATVLFAASGILGIIKNFAGMFSESAG